MAITDFFASSKAKKRPADTSEESTKAEATIASTTTSPKKRAKTGEEGTGEEVSPSEKGKADIVATKNETVSTAATTTTTAAKPAPSSKFASSKFASKSSSSSSSSSSAPAGTQECAQEMLESLHDDAWRTSLLPITTTPTFRNLARFVESERKSKKIFPPKDEVFSAYNLTPLEKVKVVIIGQDPYHGPGQGHGLCFSVKRGIAIPPSLRNIYKEAVADGVLSAKPEHGFLESWAEQGVFMLNTVMTVRQGEANSHAKRGWESFTEQAIKVLNKERTGLVFLLWGKPAQDKGVGIDRKKHMVISSSHPSPLGATKTAAPFIGSKCFSKCNAELVKQGQEPIVWEVPK